MQLNWLDLTAFCAFIIFVVGVSLYMGRKEETDEDYFLAGRGLSWWLIGFSLIASNISTEHFVGMAGEGYSLGLAIASFEWMAAVTLVIVAIFFLPKFLESGIYTMPEYLEYRFSPAARGVMAFYMMLAYVLVAMASVLYAGALALEQIFAIETLTGIWLIGILAGLYTTYGGLKAVVWSDLIQGIALLLGGAIITVLGFQQIGGWEAFTDAAGDKLHTVLPWDHPEMPWVAVFIGGLWIPNLFYWGLNQFIVQRTLGAKSLAEGQRGIFLAAGLKLVIPFIIVFPGIMAAELYPEQIALADQAYPVMMREILPTGLTGIMFAALFGALMSSLDSMLNSAATIFTMDLYRRGWRPNRSSRHYLTVGRVATGILAVIACLWAPFIESFGGVFAFIQEFWGFFSPGIVAAFLFGLFSPRTPARAATTALILSPFVYALLMWQISDVAYLNRIGITFLILAIVMGAVTALRPLSEPVTLPKTDRLDLTTSPHMKLMAALIVIATAALYIIFW